MTEDKKIDSQLMRQFVNVFSSVKGYKVINWKEASDAIGITFMKDYPDNLPYVPAKNSKGKKVNVVMVRIGYYLKNITPDLHNVPLIVDVGKYDLYRFENFLNNLEDENSPTNESLDASKKSKLPETIDILSKYEFDLVNNKIYDTKKSKQITAQELVDYAYKLHLRTLTDIPFRSKLLMRDKLASVIDPINYFFKKVIYYLFGKTIEVPRESKYDRGIISPYKLSDMHDLSDKIKILGSELPITIRSAYTFIVFSFIVYLCHYFWNYNLFGFYKLMSSTNNTFFLAVLTGGGLLFFDKIIPLILFYNLQEV